MSKNEKKGGLTGKQKAAILLISLGPDVSASVYKHLSEEEIERLTLEISSVRKVDSLEKENILTGDDRVRGRKYYFSELLDLLRKT